ncbi:TraR/DksA C4-type zinc finger protein [Kaustia mangrovi]|uniref:TraR/DksA C4-type zinc finger protein n=1 Tax=Kaustia mangrovi TaxID=2593653 RepID=A0A7S8C5I6_9HYPH|nr:TraR/DksA C4-type zinc finger protein [Kaustia mangrovi]QPC43790.1 TraR/DksA C4-type zinc finger protein [Kaustia mangrovi]
MVHDDADPARKYKPRIEAELAGLEAESEAGSADRQPVALDQQSVGRLSRMDAMQVQAMAMAAERRRQARIHKLRKALSRIADGEYGYCETCGEAIAAGRLDVDPTAAQCIHCTRLNER